MFEVLKNKYNKKHITKAALKTYVKMELLKPGTGITPEEFKEITGQEYK